MHQVSHLSAEVHAPWRRLALAFALLAGLTLSCSIGTGPDQQVASPAPAGNATENPLFIPEVQSGGSQEAGQTASGQTTPDTLYLPQVSSGSGGPAGPPLQVAANVETLKVGETVTVTASTTGVEKTIFNLSIQDAGAAGAQALAQVNAANEAQSQEGASQVFELISAEGSAEMATFILRAKAAGSATINVTATGETAGESGSIPWSGEGPLPILLTVTE